MKEQKQGDVIDFLTGHPTYWEKLEIPDEDCKDYFGITEIPTEMKSKFRNVFNKGVNQLIDIGMTMPIFNFDTALFLLKRDHQLSLPIRLREWGWKEPLTLDELDDHLHKLYDRCQLMADNALIRWNTFRKSIQTKLDLSEHIREKE